VLLQKEPCAKQVAVEVEELFLEVETNGEEDGLVVDVAPHNIVQPYSGQGGEEALARSSSTNGHVYIVFKCVAWHVYL